MIHNPVVQLMSKNKPAKIRLLVVDDHAVVRLGIEQALKDQSGIKIIGTASNGEEAIDFAQDESPDVILMDCTMPGMSGLQAMQSLLEIDTDIKIIMFSETTGKRHAREAIDAGAYGYLSKSNDPDEIATAIYAVHDDEFYLDENLAKRIASTDEDSARMQALSEREVEVAMLLASGESTSGIVEILNMDASDVYKIRSELLKILGLKNSVELAHFMLSRGEL